MRRLLHSCLHVNCIQSNSSPDNDHQYAIQVSGCILREVLGSIRNHKTIKKIIQKRKTGKKLDQYQKPHAKPINFDISTIKFLLDLQQWQVENREVSQLFEISLQLFEISLQLFEISAAQIEKKVVPTYEKRKTTSKPNLKTKNQMPKKNGKFPNHNKH